MYHDFIVRSLVDDQRSPLYTEIGPLVATRGGIVKDVGIVTLFVYRKVRGTPRIVVDTPLRSLHTRLELVRESRLKVTH